MANSTAIKTKPAFDLDIELVLVTDFHGEKGLLITSEYWQ